ncbi:hypothetical protein WJX84_011674 [Apatococcus fuscideae]|uniref:Uncharacterized protein n=1 Tax=Apatococcus fuscideae TaxID=2026836 RepID=A0AAW1TBV5_9CHLO
MSAGSPEEGASIRLLQLARSAQGDVINLGDDAEIISLSDDTSEGPSSSASADTSSDDEVDTELHRSEGLHIRRRDQKRGRGGKRHPDAPVPVAVGGQLGGRPAGALKGGVQKPASKGVHASPNKATRRGQQQDQMQANIAQQHRLMIAAQQAAQAQLAALPSAHPPTPAPAAELCPAAQAFLQAWSSFSGVEVSRGETGPNRVEDTLCTKDFDQLHTVLFNNVDQEHLASTGRPLPGDMKDLHPDTEEMSMLAEIIETPLSPLGAPGNSTEQAASCNASSIS